MSDTRPIVLTLTSPRGGDTIDVHVGDVLETDDGQHLQLIDVTQDAITTRGYAGIQYLLIDVKTGLVDGYISDLDELWRYYHIKRVVPRP